MTQAIKVIDPRAQCGLHAMSSVVKPEPLFNVLSYGLDCMGNSSGWQVSRLRNDGTLEVAQTFPANVYVPGSCAFAQAEAIALCKKLNRGLTGQTNSS